MKTWKIDYTLENGYSDEVIVCAVNKMMAWEVFTDIAEDFDCKVISANCVRIIEGD